MNVISNENSQVFDIQNSLQLIKILLKNFEKNVI